MLINPKFRDEFLSGDKVADGVFFSTFDFNFEHTLAERLEFGKQIFPPLNKIYNNGEYDENWINSFGVADNVEQILEYFKTAITDPDRDYCIGLTTVFKSLQEPNGGWRWHKWGPYIGTHEITTEYLYDEPIVEDVIVFEIIMLADRTKGKE